MVVHNPKVKFFGAREHVEEFLRYAKNLREYLENDPWPDVDSFVALTKQIKSELTGTDKVPNLCLEQKCSVHIEFLCKFLADLAEKSLEENDGHERLQAFVDVYCHLIAQLLGNISRCAQGMYGSRAMEKILSLYCPARKASLVCDYLVEDVAKSWLLIFDEIASPDKECGMLWPLIEDQYACHVLRCVFAASVGASHVKGEQMVEAQMDKEAVQKVSDLVTHLFVTNRIDVDMTLHIFKQLYTSSNAAPTLQVLLSGFFSAEFITKETKKKVKEGLLKVVEDEKENIGHLEYLALESKVGCRMMEFVLVECLDNEVISALGKSFIMPRLMSLVTHDLGNFVLQAYLKSPGLRGKQLDKVIKEADFKICRLQRPAVLRSMAEQCVRLETHFSQFLTKLRECLGRAEDKVFWPRVISLDVTAGKKFDCKTTAPGESLAQALLKFPWKLMKPLFKELVKTFERSASDTGSRDGSVKALLLDFTKERSYFVQACLKAVKKDLRMSLIRSLIPHTLAFAKHPKASFVLGDMIDLSREDLHNQILDILKPEQNQLMAINFSLYKRCKFDVKSDRFIPRHMPASKKRKV